MKSLLSYLVILVLLSGCATKYVEPLSTQPVAHISFERDAKTLLLGSTTVFVALDDTYLCNPASGFMGQQKMATIDKGNPLVKNQNNGPIKILAKSNYRLLVRNIAGYSRCDVVLGFKSEQGKSYKLKAITDFKSSDFSCSVKIAEVNSGTEIDLDFVEYKECSNAS